MFKERRCVLLRLRSGYSAVFCRAGDLHATAPRARGAGALCDSSFENCRFEIINGSGRTRRHDVATWFFEDRTFTKELIAKWQAGVPVRVIADPDANVSASPERDVAHELADAGIPIRHKVSSGIEHWKLMLFSGQNVVYFGSANFSADAFVPVQPVRNFVDETIYLTDDATVVDTLRTRFEDAWVNTTGVGELRQCAQQRRLSTISDGHDATRS